MNTKPRIFATCLMAIIIVFGLWQEFDYLSATEQLAEDTLAQAEAHLGKDNRTQSLRAVKNGAKDDLATLEEARLTKAKLVSLIDSLDKIGKSLNLTLSITSITTDASKIATSTPETVRVSISTEGRWAANLAFVHVLESLPYKTNIEDSNLTKTDKGWRGDTIIKLVTLPETQ